jgi:hypothetical protein
MRSLLSIALAALLGSGCSAARLGMHFADTRIGEHVAVSNTGIGDAERRAKLTLQSAPLPPMAPPEIEELPPPADPPPLEPAEPLPEPPPGPVPEPPLEPPVEVAEPIAPPPASPPQEVAPFPPPDAPPAPTERLRLKLGCSVEERHEQELVHSQWTQFGIVEKITLGFIGIGTGMMAIGAGVSVVDDKTGELDVPALTFATIFAADTLGLWALAAFMPTMTKDYEDLRPGIWRRAGSACPANIVVRRHGRELRVGPEGTLDEGDEAWLLASLLAEGGGLVVSSPYGEETIVPLRTDVCRWAERRGHEVSPRCAREQGTYSWGVKSGAMLPLTPAPAQSR